MTLRYSQSPVGRRPHNLAGTLDEQQRYWVRVPFHRKCGRAVGTLWNVEDSDIMLKAALPSNNEYSD
jgi:hypothetical protein